MGKTVDQTNEKLIVKKELSELTKEAKKYNIADIKSGNWFLNFTSYALKNYSEKVNAQYFKDKYPNVPIEGVVSKRISIAQKYAAIGGAVTGAAYSGTIAATIGSSGGSSPLTVPAAVTSFVVDLMYTTKLQLNLAYDLSVLYNQEIDIADPEDIGDLFNVAFGIKAGQNLTNVVTKATPEITRRLIKRKIKGEVLQKVQDEVYKVIGKKLLQRNIIKFSIPVVSIALNSGMNYFFTGRIAKQAKRIYKSKALINEQSNDLSQLINDEFIIFLEVVWLVILSDEKVKKEEVDFMKQLTQIALNKSEINIQKEISELSNRVTISKQKVFEKVILLDNDTKEVIYQSACNAAAIDGKLAKKELKFLEELSLVTNQKFDKKTVKNFL